MQLGFLIISVGMIGGRRNVGFGILQAVPQGSPILVFIMMDLYRDKKIELLRGEAVVGLGYR